MGGGSQSTTTVVKDPPSAEQTALTQKQIELSQAQLDAINRSTAFQEQIFNNAQPLFDMQSEVFKSLLADINDPVQQKLKSEQAQFALDTIPIQREVLQKQLEDLRRNGAASPEQEALIKQATDAALSSGTSDIDRAQADALSHLRDFATERGLRAGDSPILDRAGRVAGESVRGKADLASNLRGIEATSKLNFPLAAGQLANQQSAQAQAVSSAAQAFQQSLRDAALSARMQFGGQISSNILGAASGGLGIASGAAGGVSALAPAIAAMNNSRGTTQSTSTSSSPGFLQVLTSLGQIAGAAGGAYSGFSSRTLKTDKKPLDLDAALAAVDRIPVEAWRYKPGVVDDGRMHIGAYAEDMARATGVGDGKTINFLDAIGLTLAAVKGLKRKVDEIKEGFAFARAAA